MGATNVSHEEGQGAAQRAQQQDGGGGKDAAREARRHLSPESCAKLKL